MNWLAVGDLPELLAIGLGVGPNGNLISASGEKGQASASPTSAPHERLGVFEGVWTRRDLPDGTTFRDTCEWLAGRRHMVCRQRLESGTTVREQMATYSYPKTSVMSAFAADCPSGSVSRALSAAAASRSRT